MSEVFGAKIAERFGGREAQVLGHPRYRLHIVTSRGRHVLGREHRIGTPLGYFGAFVSNSLHRKAMGMWLERVVFSAPETGSTCPLPFGVDDYPTRQVELSEENKRQILVPEGFGHGFLTVSEFADVQYKCSSYYRPETEGALHWKDQDLDIDWGIDNPTVSDRDSQAMSFEDYRRNPAF